MFVCKFCNKEIECPAKRGAHVRNCVMNPKRNESNRKAKQTNSKRYLKKLYKFVCKKCGKVITLLLTDNQYKRSRCKDRFYCSNKCYLTRNEIIVKCLNCGAKLQYDKRKRKKKYCNGNCLKEYRYKKYIEDWKNGLESGMCKFDMNPKIRKYISEKYNNSCCKCGWHEVNIKTGKTPLQMEHIDGNYKNNKEANLELLCPNCHSLTGTYGSLNKGNGRRSRKLRVQIPSPAPKV